MAERPCSGQASEAVLTAEHAAVEMYRFAALLLGNEAEALRLVESTVAAVDIDPCADPARAEGLVRERVVEGALAILHHSDPSSFDQVPAPAATSSCLEEDEASPVSRSEIAALVAAGERGVFRDWLDRLSLAQRAVFIVRAVLGSSNTETARDLNRFAQPAKWTAEAVGSLFRQALCSLASAMVQSAPAVRA